MTKPVAALIAEFRSGQEALAAARGLYAQGFRELELHAPYELDGAEEALGLARPRWLPRLVLFLGLCGAATGYLVQWFTNSISYPLLVGGRPIHPAPAFIPITFEMGILFGSIAAFVGLLAGGRLLQLWQPVFEAPGFEHATIDGYWLRVDAEDPLFDELGTREILESLDPIRIEILSEGQ